MIMSTLITLPVLLPLITALLLFFVRKNPLLVNGLSLSGAVLALVTSAMLMAQTAGGDIHSVAFSNWSAPFGIVFVADLLSASMVLVSALIGLCTVLYAAADLKGKPSYGVYHVLFHFLMTGVNGAFLTGDIFNLYVWFEVMLIASFGLMIINASKVQIDGAIKYAVLNLVATLVFLLAIALLYGATGTLNMAALHEAVPNIPAPLMITISGMFIFCFGVKAAVFPLFAWLPASYHTMPSAVVALFAALLTKVGVYAYMRFFTLIFPLDVSGWQDVLIALAALTMLIGVLGAVIQKTIKKILSFHIISQIGYMMAGLTIYTPLALTGAIFYIIHHIIVKANLFLIGGVLEKRYGSDSLDKIGGAYKLFPFLSFLFIIPAFSLAGFPPLSGFWGKLLVIKAGLLDQHFMLAGIALFVGLLTIFSMTKIWAAAFWKPKPEGVELQPQTMPITALSYAPIIILTSSTVFIGLYATPFLDIATEAAAQLLNPQAYVSAVLGGHNTP